ncbi:MAG: hypothetical protein PHF58_09980 [Methylotenera sp.]|nr:hypothetical protein [Methylotenera sp.]
MSALNRLIEAFNAGDYSSLTLSDIFLLVDQKILRSETAESLTKKVFHGTNQND